MQERHGEHYQHDDCRGGPDGGSAHHAGGDAIPATRLGDFALLGNVTADVGDALSGADKDRGQDEESEGTGSQHDDGTGHSHGVHEALGEDGKGCHRRRDRDRAEQHGVASGAADCRQSLLDRAVSPVLLTKARHDEEAEVDGEPQPEGDHEVEGEDRKWQDEDHEAHDAQGDGDGEQGADKRDCRRPPPPEDEEEQQDEERQDEELGSPKVLRRDSSDLDVGDRRSAEPDIALERRMRRNGAFERRNCLLLLHGADGGHDNGELPVVRDHGPVAGVGVVEDALYLRARPE